MALAAFRGPPFLSSLLLGHVITLITFSLLLFLEWEEEEEYNNKKSNRNAMTKKKLQNKK